MSDVVLVHNDPWKIMTTIATQNTTNTTVERLEYLAYRVDVMNGEGKVLLVNSSTSLGVVMGLRHAQVRIFIHKKSSTITITLSTTPSLYLPVIF